MNTKMRRALALLLAGTALAFCGIAMPLAAYSAEDEQAAVRVGSLSDVQSTSAGGDAPGYTVERANSAPLEAGFTVENFQHPGAGRIAVEFNILLKEGDGNIIHQPCDPLKEQITVESSTGDFSRDDYPKLCFGLTGDKGWLTMEIPGSYLVKAPKKHAVTATTTDDLTTRTVVVPADKPVYVDTSAEQTGVVVVELRVG
ncbi:hypothetical protein ACFVU2_09160 [Leifsonia sp. NPDC058194]|uniref:hypothetical protein n=1 Tax=Leifsonia sp. NPDC058194 TaxID=3346374 RepID=UPI0036DA0234